MGAGFIEARGVSVPVMGSFDEPDGNKVGRISPASIRAAALSLLRPGGLAAIDNVLWSGKVVETAPEDPDIRAIQTLNAALKDDSRVTISMLSLGDGLTLARKR